MALIHLFLLLLPFGCTSEMPAVSENIALPELTAKQKVADVKYFFNFVRESFPFVEAIEGEKGLSCFYDYEESYINRAKKTKSNLEFMSLFMEMMQRIEQGTGHADVAPPLTWTDDSELDDEIAQYGISLESFYGQIEWWKLFNNIKTYSFSDIPLMYLDGLYVTTKDYNAKETNIPKGASIFEIDNMPVDEYVKSNQHKTWLRFDRRLKKPYDSNGTPFVTFGDSQKKPWAVRFRLDDGHSIDCNLPKLTDPTKVPPRSTPESNVICMELSDELGYIKVASFPGVSARREEHKVIRDFITRAQGKHNKRILDLRRNSGGSPVYWEENLIRYFIKEPVNYIQYAAVKKKIYDRLERPFRATRMRMRRYYDSGTFRKVLLKDLPWPDLPGYFNDKDWYFFEIRRTYSPFRGFDLKCQVYVLTDNDCFSAAEDFVKTIRQHKLATLVGATTCGGAAAFIEPWLFELPNSHIIFTLEIELAFNPDGTINEIYGTIPDFELEPSRYPTTFPGGFSKEELLKDSWIQWVIKK